MVLGATLLHLLLQFNMVLDATLLDLLLHFNMKLVLRWGQPAGGERAEHVARTARGRLNTFRQVGPVEPS